MLILESIVIGYGLNIQGSQVDVYVPKNPLLANNKMGSGAAEARWMEPLLESKLPNSMSVLERVVRRGRLEVFEHGMAGLLTFGR